MTRPWLAFGCGQNDADDEAGFNDFAKDKDDDERGKHVGADHADRRDEDARQRDMRSDNRLAPHRHRRGDWNCYGSKVYVDRCSHGIRIFAIARHMPPPGATTFGSRLSARASVASAR